MFNDLHKRRTVHMSHLLFFLFLLHHIFRWDLRTGTDGSTAHLVVHGQPRAWRPRRPEIDRAPSATKNRSSYALCY